MREIRDELYVAKGRLSVVGLQDTLNVDLVHIEERVDELLKTDGQLNLIQGELIDQCVAAVYFVYTQLARLQLARLQLARLQLARLRSCLC